MDPRDVQRTLAKFDRMERGAADLLNPKRYVQIVAGRLAYLRTRAADLQKRKQPTTFFEQETSAIMWLLAHYSAETGYDVRSVLSEGSRDGPVDIERYDSIASALQITRQRTALGPSRIADVASDTSSSASE